MFSEGAASVAAPFLHLRIRLNLYSPPKPVSNNITLIGSGIVEFVSAAVPSTTKLSIRFVPVEDVAPLNTIRKAAVGLLFNPRMLDKVNTTGAVPNALSGT